MTVSTFETFEKDLFEKLRKNSKGYLKIIEENEKLIDNYLNGNDQSYVQQFVNNFNDVVLDRKIKKYKLFEAVLNHKLFTNVLAQFRQSDVLIRACKDLAKHRVFVEREDYDESVNKNVVEWLLTMNINYGVQDELGMTALMYAVKPVKLHFAVKKMMSGKHIYLLDNNGNNVLFHSADNFFTLEKFLKYKDVYDGNHLNNDNENILSYCSRNRKITNIEFLKMLGEFHCTEPNITNREGKTAAMYLTEYIRYKELDYFVKNYKIDPNAVNKFGNSLVSVLSKKYYQYISKIIQEDKEGFGTYLIGVKRYVLTFRTLADLGCNFNIPIDENGNTVAMVLSKLHDVHISSYLLDKGCMEYLVENKTNKDNTYLEINENNPVVNKNHKSISKWTKEAICPSGTLNTETLGLIMLGILSH